MDFDSALISFCYNGCHHICCRMGNDRDLMVDGIGFKHAFDAFEGSHQSFGIFVLADVQHQRFRFTNLFGEFLLRTNGDQLAVVNDAYTV